MHNVHSHRVGCIFHDTIYGPHVKDAVYSMMHLPMIVASCAFLVPHPVCPLCASLPACAVRYVIFGFIWILTGNSLWVLPNMMSDEVRSHGSGGQGLLLD